MSYDLQWEHHNHHLNKQLESFLKSKDFFDVTIVCDGKKQIKGHKVILAAGSEVFRNMLKDSNSSTTVYLRGVDSEEFSYLLKFLYSGSVTLPENMVMSKCIYRHVFFNDFLFFRFQTC